MNQFTPVKALVSSLKYHTVQVIDRATYELVTDLAGHFTEEDLNLVFGGRDWLKAWASEDWHRTIRQCRTLRANLRGDSAFTYFIAQLGMLESAAEHASRNGDKFIISFKDAK